MSRRLLIFGGTTSIKIKSKVPLLCNLSILVGDQVLKAWVKNTLTEGRAVYSFIYEIEIIMSVFHKLWNISISLQTQDHIDEVYSLDLVHFDQPVQSGVFCKVLASQSLFIFFLFL